MRHKFQTKLRGGGPKNQHIVMINKSKRKFFILEQHKTPSNTDYP